MQIPREPLAGDAVAEPVVEGVGFGTVVAGAEDYALAAARSRLLLHCADERLPHPAAAPAGADHERGQAARRLVALDQWLDAQPGQTRNQAVDLGDEHE